MDTVSKAILAVIADAGYAVTVEPQQITAHDHETGEPIGSVGPPTMI